MRVLYPPAQISQGQAGNNIALWVPGSIWAACHGEPMSVVKAGTNRPHLQGREEEECFPFPTQTFHVQTQAQQPWLCYSVLLSEIHSRPQYLLYTRAMVFPSHPPFSHPLACPKLLTSLLKSGLFEISYFKPSPLLFFFENAIVILIMQRLCYSECLRLSYEAVIMKSNLHCTMSHSKNSKEF